MSRYLCVLTFFGALMRARLDIMVAKWAGTIAKKFASYRSSHCKRSAKLFPTAEGAKSVVVKGKSRCWSRIRGSERESWQQLT